MSAVGPIDVSPGLPGGASAVLDITTATIVKAAPGVCFTVTVLAAGSAGTLTINDAASLGDANASNMIYSCDYDDLPPVIRLSWPCGSGIVVSSLPTDGAVSVAFT
jgi:hypothetical protein